MLMSCALTGSSFCHLYGCDPTGPEVTLQGKTIRLEFVLFTYTCLFLKRRSEAIAVPASHGGC